MAQSDLNDSINLKISIDEEELPKSYLIGSVNIENNISKIPFALLRLYNNDNGKYDKIDFGSKIKIECGYKEDVKNIFNGIVTSINVLYQMDGNNLVTLVSRDVSFKTTLSKKTKFFEKKN